MPATQEEKFNFAEAVLDGAVMPDEVPRWADGDLATEEELHTVFVIARYIAGVRRAERVWTESRPVRRKAMALLRQFLSPVQLAQLQRNRCFYVTTASGRHYRLEPHTGRVEEVTFHRTRYFMYRRFCIHPAHEDGLPPADVSLSHLLLLSWDEEEFLRRANVARERDQLWNGIWFRRLRANRLARAQDGERIAADMQLYLEAA